MRRKWHKNCGGQVVYQKPKEKTSFKQAGFCKKCDAFPIVQEDIIFHLGGMAYERYEDKSKFPSWRITTKGRLKEVLEY